MSYGGYNPYNDNDGGRGYGSDPFDDRNALQYGAGTHEMSSFNSGNSPQVAQQGYGSPRAQNQISILDECTDIQNGVQDVENKLAVLGGLQKRALDEADMSDGSRKKDELDKLTQAIMDQYRSLTDRLREVKQRPESRHPRNVAQVNKTDRDLRRAIQRFQELESGSRKQMRAQVERQARIVHPDATEAEIADIVNSDTQIFQQAVMRGGTQQANAVLGAVKQRHQQMLEVEQTLLELLDLINDVQVLLAKQEEVVMAIDTNAEQAAGDMVKANEQLEVAVVTARKTRKKKWICLGICVTIVVIIVVAVVAYIMVNRAATGGGGGGGDNNNNNNNADANNNNNNNNNNANNNNANNANTNDNDNNGNGNANSGGQKRSLFQQNVMDDLQMNTARAVEISADVARSSRLSRRRSNRARGFGVPPDHEVESLTKKRFVVDWQGAEPTGSDD
ncbi:t-SNARE [Chaetomidium leptoderma]|uniref:t-SNARE n=1 Tax=Chaetomidium leptoderma TaxID=669021 RepID=A0AAN6ZWY5_9PEZI|nr:t-SNARE [Chaetomidium leptoderma]